MTLQEAIEVLNKSRDKAIREFANTPDSDYALHSAKWLNICYTLDDTIDLLKQVDE